MISKYIKSLLTDNKRVIIPNLGGLVVKRSASGDIISFNNFLNFNDNILADAVATGESIDKEAALNLVSNYANRLNQELETASKTEITEVGFLIKDKKGNIRFISSDEETNITSQISEETVDDTQRKHTPIAVADRKAETTNTETEEDVKPLPINNRQKKKPIFIWLAAFILVIAAALAWIFKDSFNKKVHNKEAVTETVVSETPIVSETPEYAMQPLEKVIMSGITLLADKNIATKGNERYNIIFGSFQKYKNAEAYNQKLIKFGLDSQIFDRYNGFHAVSYNEYITAEEALRSAGELINNHPDIWILVK